MKFILALVILALAILAGPVGAGLDVPATARALLALVGVALAVAGGLSYRARR